MLRISRGFRAVAIYRLGRWTDSGPANPALSALKRALLPAYACCAFLVAKAYGIQIDRRAVIGKGLFVGHFAGIVIGRCRLGENCSVHQHVQIEDAQIGDNVWIGAHARIVGPVRIGSNVTIAAGAVVTQNVPDGCLVAGAPARVVNPRYDNSSLLGTAYDETVRRQS